MSADPPDVAPAAPDTLHPPAPAVGQDTLPDAADAVDPLHPGLVRTGVVLAFLIGGPPLGTFVVALPLLLFGALDGGDAPIDALAGALAISLFSYLFGAVPALLTGAVAAWYWPRLHGWRAHARIGVVGLLLSLICLGIAFAVLDTRRDFIETFTMALLCSLPGFVGATLVSRLLQALR
ncbi:MULTISPECIES: hypothetical protein [Xanthomonas]|uniref:hypothetical protein n=1 Tax=Xanthomonas TaxID=338 RepID=UPI0030B8A9C0